MTVHSITLPPIPAPRPLWRRGASPPCPESRRCPIRGKMLYLGKDLQGDPSVYSKGFQGCVFSSWTLCLNSILVLMITKPNKQPDGTPCTQYIDLIKLETLKTLSNVSTWHPWSAASMTLPRWSMWKRCDISVSTISPDLGNTATVSSEIRFGHFSIL